MTLLPPKTTYLRQTQIIGRSKHYPLNKTQGIPLQWQDFAPTISSLTTDPNPTTYGVNANSTTEGFDYLCGIEASPTNQYPESLSTIQLTAGNYLVFEHTDHISILMNTCDAIWSQWIPESGLTVASSPWFERYGPQFNPDSGLGGLEVWIPIQTTGSNKSH